MYFYYAENTGAWIETRYRCKYCYLLHVAPFAGAWIETHVIAIKQ